MTIREIIAKLSRMLFGVLTIILLVVGAGTYFINMKLAEVAETASVFAKAVDQSRSAQIAFQRQVQEWKNILIRGNDSEMYDKYLNAFHKQAKVMDTHLSDLKTLMASKNLDVSAVSTLQDTHAALGKRYISTLEAVWLSNDPEAGKKVDLNLRGIDRETSAQMDKLAENIQKQADAAIDQMKKDAALISQYTLYAIIAVSLFGLFVLGSTTRKARSGLMKMIGLEPVELSKSLTSIANGDLTTRVTLKEGDRESMAAQVVLMQRKIKNMISSVKNGSSELEQVSDKIADANSLEDIKTYVKEARQAARGLSSAADRFQTE